MLTQKENRVALVAVPGNRLVGSGSDTKRIAENAELKKARRNWAVEKKRLEVELKDSKAREETATAKAKMAESKARQANEQQRSLRTTLSALKRDAAGDAREQDGLRRELKKTEGSAARMRQLVERVSELEASLSSEKTKVAFMTQQRAACEASAQAKLHGVTTGLEAKCARLQSRVTAGHRTCTYVLQMAQQNHEEQVLAMTKNMETQLQAAQSMRTAERADFEAAMDSYAGEVVFLRAYCEDVRRESAEQVQVLARQLEITVSEHADMVHELQEERDLRAQLSELFEYELTDTTSTIEFTKNKLAADLIAATEAHSAEVDALQSEMAVSEETTVALSQQLEMAEAMNESAATRHASEITCLKDCHAEAVKRLEQEKMDLQQATETRLATMREKLSTQVDLTAAARRELLAAQKQLSQIQAEMATTTATAQYEIDQLAVVADSAQTEAMSAKLEMEELAKAHRQEVARNKEDAAFWTQAQLDNTKDLMEKMQLEVTQATEAANSDLAALQQTLTSTEAKHAQELAVLRNDKYVDICAERVCSSQFISV